MFAKRFFYVCTGLFLLAGAYALGARSAGAQAPGNAVVALTLANSQSSSPPLVAVTSNGDSYYSNDTGATWMLRGNVFSSPTPNSQETLGGIKARYR